jgi:diacylglycerol kinase family enzyme
LAFANATQYGIGAKIAPEGQVQDGHLNLTILYPFQWYDFFLIPPALFFGQIHRIRRVQTYRIQELKVTPHISTTVHIDGEIVNLSPPIEVTILNKALNVVVPKSKE